MAGRSSVDEMAAVIMAALEEYADLAADDLKKAVKKAGATVRKEIQANAPKQTGDYAKSWAAKTVKETANSLTLTVYSKNRYWLAHLLEFGHAKRNGGRVSGKVHIAPAEELAARKFEEEIERSLRNG